ncbi:acyl-CoA dehydrogenase family protein [Actinomadura rubrisoli]|uniref:Hydrolase n=1 Tax=Actinomadura rubrisoli TaxID=2530368 RepID=A0A4R5AN69_9ACTN|nr:acyl-CoA dehydrogenase family protein [Actinomadura rubrisoli]TDD73465.1 hydrolase [Actinomadura rubrisoli]
MPLSDMDKARIVAGTHAAEAENARRLPPEVVDALVAAGFARHLVPARWGGTAGGLTELGRAVATVGEGCASAAWCASLYAHSARFGAFLPEQGQRELWEQGPDTLVVAGLVPTGEAVAVPGGTRLTGTWRYTSAVHSADWALVCGPADGDEIRFFAVPRSDFTIEDTWFSTGMRATASNTLVLDGVFVPEHRAFLRDSAFAGRPVGSGAPCHTVPMRAVNGLPFATPILGAATGAHHSAAEIMSGRSPSAAALLALARAAGEIDAAALLLDRAAAGLDGGGVTPADAARNARDNCLAVELLVGATDRLFRAVGTAGQAQDHPLQRFWRDVNTAASHVALRMETAGTIYAQQLLASRKEMA